jgi:GNAT acetyltransferase-like protein
MIFAKAPVGFTIPRPTFPRCAVRHAGHEAAFPSNLRSRTGGISCGRFKTSGVLLIETARLILHPWRESDRPLFAEQNADPIVMLFLAGVLTREESDAYVDRVKQHLAETGICKWAVEAPGIAPFIGAVGLSRVSTIAPGITALERRDLASFTPRRSEPVAKVARGGHGAVETLRPPAPDASNYLSI